MTFLLDARLDLTAEEQELFERYRLAGVVVYDSDARVQHAYSAAERYEAAADAAQAVPIFPAFEEMHIALGNAAASFWHLGAGLSHSFVSALSLQVTLESLASGIHLESASLEETLSVERAITASVQYLADYFHLALTFDGREELSEF